MRLKTRRFTIERLRTAVLIGGGLLIAAIAIFLGLGQWRLYRQVRDLPKRLGIDIQQQADGVNYTQSRKGKTLFKIHAARAVEMKTSGKMLLHDVRIDLYGEDGSRTDTISGSEFEYDHSAGIAQAAGAVEITLMRPGVKPAITQLNPVSMTASAPASAKPQASALPHDKSGNKSGPDKSGLDKFSTDKSNTDDHEIHVKTSGLSFNQKSGVATTNQRVDFALKQGSGSSTGATYDSSKGQLILDRDVELHVDRDGDPVAIHATHADFERSQQLCLMTAARAEYTGGTVKTANALMHFREDGSILRLDGSGGVDLQTSTGSHAAAPRGDVEFDEQNHPARGLLEGGATLAMTQPAREIDATAPTVRLQFNGDGQLRQAHMERGVLFNSQQQVVNAKGTAGRVNRTWKSQVADVSFVPVTNSPGTRQAHTQDGLLAGLNSTEGNASSQVEPRTIRGSGAVVVTTETIAVQGRDLATLSADTVQAELAPGGNLTTLSGAGHAHFDQKTAQGVHQASSSDQLDVRFAANPAGSENSSPLANPAEKKSVAAGGKQPLGSAGSEIASIAEVGSVVFEQEAPPSSAKEGKQAGKSGSGPAAQQPIHANAIRATSNRADYDGSTEILHLTGSPRVRDGELDMTANTIDFARVSGDAFAHGNVKASWANAPSGPSLPGPSLPGPSPPGATLSGISLLGDSATDSRANNGPMHAVAPEAEFHQSTGQVIFRAAPGKAVATSAASQPRLWQAGNSISAPLILLNREKQTLTAQSDEPANPVRTVLVSNGPITPAKSVRASPQESASTAKKSPSSQAKPRQNQPSTIRLRSGDLHYSEGERIALLHAGSAGSVIAETSNADGTSTVVSQQAEVRLLPAGIHAAPRSPAGNSSTQSTEPGSNSPSNSPGYLSNNSPGNSSNPSSPGSSIDRLTATGHVSVEWPDRKGTGEKLVYLADQGTFTLTGTSGAPPRITDQARGTVTGNALIFHTGDDSVTVEGDGGKTTTETQAPSKHAASHATP